MKLKLWLPLFSLFLVFLIFSTSLIMASQDNGRKRVSEKCFYFNRKILPNHIFYSVLMLGDKIILDTAHNQRKIEVRVRLSKDRLKSAKLLLEQGEEDLALSTFTKSEKYLILASQDYLQAIENDEDVEGIRKQLFSALRSNYYQLQKSQKEFQRLDTTPIGDLLIELEVLINRLECS